ncbi:MAG: long-chain-fatty-acid--CoA ligase [Arenicellales bacterium]|nr:long-chain-fatty-acid--CoA ligase [Arenicellales bacterium]
METPLTPMEFARRARRLYREREGVVDGELRFTYGEFLERCDRWSTALQSLGVEQGDRVAYIAPNTHAHLEAYYAVPQIGAVLVPINFRLKPEDFAYIINHCGARAICAHPDHLEAIDAIRGQIPAVEVFVALEGSGDGWLDYEETLTSHDPEFEPVEISESDLITINYTSGTTARPKGVMITHRNAYINIMGTLVQHHLSPADRYLWTLPMFHANGWTFTWINTARGMTHVCLPKVEPAAIYQLIKEEGITMFCAAPTVLISIANAPEKLREGAPRGVRLFTAGAPPAAATIELIERDLGWELTHVYGLTETAPLITVCEPRPEHQILSIEERSKVKARQGVELVSSGEVRVVDEKGVEVPADGTTLGEITVRGNVVMAGYYNDPGATAAAVKDGWFHSGDAAVVHPDGYVEIRDRFKDVIISGGENISSVELEGCLLTHPAVQESAVVGMPHEKWGESPHAFVVLKQGAQATEDELKEHVRSQLAHFKTPQAVSFVEELPKTATGKVQKYVLRQHEPGIATQ